MIEWWGETGTRRTWSNLYFWRAGQVVVDLVEAERQRLVLGGRSSSAGRGADRLDAPSNGARRSRPAGRGRRPVRQAPRSADRAPRARTARRAGPAVRRSRRRGSGSARRAPGSSRRRTGAAPPGGGDRRPGSSRGAARREISSAVAAGAGREAPVDEAGQEHGRELEALGLVDGQDRDQRRHRRRARRSAARRRPRSGSGGGGRRRPPGRRAAARTGRARSRRSGRCSGAPPRRRRVCRGQLGQDAGSPCRNAYRTSPQGRSWASWL